MRVRSLPIIDFTISPEKSRKLVGLIFIANKPTDPWICNLCDVDAASESGQFDKQFSMRLSYYWQWISFWHFQCCQSADPIDYCLLGPQLFCFALTGNIFYCFTFLSVLVICPTSIPTLLSFASHAVQGWGNICYWSPGRSVWGKTVMLRPRAAFSSPRY